MQTELMPGQERERPTASSGFTVLELSVASLIFAIVAGSIFGLLEVGRKTKLGTMERNEGVQNARIALNTLSRDIINAGVDYNTSGALVPGNPSASPPTNWMTTNLLITPAAGTTLAGLSPVLPGYQLNSLTNTATNVVTKTDQVTLVLTDSSFNVTGSPASSQPLNIGSMSTTNSWLSVTDSKTGAAVANGAKAFNIGDLMIVNGPNSNQSGTIGMVTGYATNNASNDTIVAATDPMGVNDLSSGTSGNMYNEIQPTGPAGARRIKMVTYHVVDDGTGQGTGTLMRRSWGGVDSTGKVQAYADQPLAFDVTAMSIQYYLTTGTGVVITNNPSNSMVLSAGLPAVNGFSQIRQLALTITTNSPAKDPRTNLPYSETLTATFNTRNLGYEQFSKSN